MARPEIGFCSKSGTTSPIGGAPRAARRDGGAAMAFWLVKSEPGSWSWDAHVKAGVEAWTGVRNFQARGRLQAMKPGDEVLFYHSGEEKAVVGVSEVARAAYPDPTDAKGQFLAVDLRANAPLARPVSLAEIKATPELA